jgi:hypothetical protein
MLDFVECWSKSLFCLFLHHGIKSKLNRSLGTRLDHSIAVLLQTEMNEGGLILWESGHAELGIMCDGVPLQEHHEGVDFDGLAQLLARILAAVIPALESRTQTGPHGHGG